MIASSTSPPILMEKSNQHQHQHHHHQQQQEGDVYHQNQQSLKCPRCDSSNTKFCYYNNYSLSQPRHFCKACKRYWTRGGTLRNVPVGGGCRKNKRVKIRPPSISAPNSNPNPNPQSSSSNIPMLNPPLLYGLPTSTDPTHLNLPYPNFNSRVSVSGYDGLGFSSGLMHYSNPNGFSRCPIFGSPSNFQQQQQQKFMAYHEDVEEMMGGTNDGNMVIKDVKMEDSQNRLNWINSAGSQMDQIIGSSDPSSLWNTAGGVGPWLDPSNIGSSVPSLI